MVSLTSSDNIGEANFTPVMGVGEIPKKRESANTTIFVDYFSSDD
ncbi:hypothetical protein [Planktothrix tepida]|nr:hypothetical protein [Planktothrix tepida]